MNVVSCSLFVVCVSLLIVAVRCDLRLCGAVV